MKRISINESWQFTKLSPQQCPLKGETTFTEVTLPHTPYSDDDQYHGLMLYRKYVEVDPSWNNVILEFEGADQVCRVFVNGVALGSHAGGYTLFRFAVPKAMLSGTLCIDVYLQNTANPDVCPNFGDFTLFGGLYRGVNLLVVEDNHFDYCYYGTNGIIVNATMKEDKGIVSIIPHIIVQDNNAIVECSVVDPTGNIVANGTTNGIEPLLLTIDNPLLWNGKKSVALYNVNATLSVDGVVYDSTSERIGFRTIHMTPNEGLFLNGEHVKLRGVAKHQDHAGVFNAIEPKHIDEDFKLMSEMGVNAIRLSHYPHAQYTYNHCDEDGYLTWAEIPMLKMTDNQALFNNAEEQLKELILQNIHHPSIFCWGIQNEIAMFKDAPFMHDECRMLVKIAKELDPSRLTTAANLYSVKPTSELNNITDMIGYNIYFGWYYGEMKDYDKYLDKFHQTRPNMPLGVSEYGVDANTSLHSEEPKIKDYSEEYQALFHETVYPIFKSKEYLWGSFVWNMFDFSSDKRNEGGVKYINAKGLVTYDRTICKDAFYYYKSIWSNDPFVHICSKRFIKRNKEAINIKVYTSQTNVTLIINGKTIGTNENNGNGTIVFTNVPLQKGKNNVKAIHGTCVDECVFERVEQEETSYHLPEETSGPVRNWFLSDDDTIKEGYYSIMDTAQDLLENAREVLEKHVPKLVELLDKDIIPTGLSMKSILSRDLKDNPDKIIEINNALHEIKKDL